LFFKVFVFLSQQIISSSPQLSVFYSEVQIRTIQSVLSKTNDAFELYFDATGSLIRKSNKRIYLYSIVARVPLKCVQSLPLLEWFSDSHDQDTIGSVLEGWLSKANRLMPSPHLIVSDFSWAQLHALSNKFFLISLEELLERQWEAFFNKKEVPCALLLCANHLMHMICRRLKTMNIKNNVCLYLQHLFY